VKEVSVSQTCEGASISALTEHYESLIAAVAAKGQLIGGNYAEDQKIRRLLAECETAQCRRELLIGAIDSVKTEVLK
jgi:hypothetical protein